MQSTPEEFALVLRKWQSCPRKICVAAKFGSVTGCVSTVILKGDLLFEEESETVGVVASPEEMFIVGYSGAGVGFSTRDEQVSNEILRIVESREEVDEILIIKDSSGATICLFSLIEK